MAESPLLDANQVRAMLCLGVKAFKRLIAEGKFPQRMLQGNKHVWLRSDVDQYLGLRGRGVTALEVSSEPKGRGRSGNTDENP